MGSERERGDAGLRRRWYTTDWSIEQYMRPRIASASTGTNHVKLDLVGRKIPAKGAVLFNTSQMMALLKDVGDNEVFGAICQRASRGLAQLNDVVRKTLGIAMKDAEIVGTTASACSASSPSSFGYVWLRQAAFASSKSGSSMR